MEDDASRAKGISFTYKGDGSSSGASSGAFDTDSMKHELARVLSENGINSSAQPLNQGDIIRHKGNPTITIMKGIELHIDRLDEFKGPL